MLQLQFNDRVALSSCNRHVRDGREIEGGDVYSLIGNVAGIIGTVAFLAGAGGGACWRSCNSERWYWLAINT
ncbi:MAG: hypothetical protein ACTJE5_23855, partial [Pseudomonas helleri]|uniref:hypothetical protein n=1 Tax=Pseudomonas helleri TaxID=1608996 RepID=UPI003F9B3A3B